MLRDPLALGASLEGSLRPNVALWRRELPAHCDLRAELRARGLRFLSCSFARRTRPRVERARECAVPVERLLGQMRLTDSKFESWIARQQERERAVDGSAPPRQQLKVARHQQPGAAQHP